MTRCANSHPPDETCVDCEQPASTRERRLAEVRRLREQLAATPSPDIAIDHDSPDEAVEGDTQP